MEAKTSVSKMNLLKQILVVYIMYTYTFLLYTFHAFLLINLNSNFKMQVVRLDILSVCDLLKLLTLVICNLALKFHSASEQSSK